MGKIVAWTRVSREDFTRLSKFRWFRSTNGYAVRRLGRGREYMHRAVARTPKGKLTDHIDGNKLNNTRSNLRHADQFQNQQNRKCVGVNYKSGGWETRIRVRRKEIYLGRHRSFKAACAVRRSAEKKYFGRFAHRI